MNTLNDKEVGTFEAKNKLSSLLDEAASGRRIWITKRGKRVALLSSGIGKDLGNGNTLKSDFRDIRNSSKRGDESIKSLIEEGRR
ncbi:MAG: type II toxin-antitoxin system Phd/YefM family antitoxin [Opitutales bacterium]